MQPALQVFRAVTASPMARSPSSAVTASSGVLPYTLQSTPGTGPWSISTPPLPVAPPIRVLVFRFDVSGIIELKLFTAGYLFLC